MVEGQSTNGVLILDIPVVHRGYIDLLRRYTDGRVETLFLVGEDVLRNLGVRKEIRANDPETTRRMLGGLELPFRVEILTLDKTGELAVRRIYTAKDDVSRRFHERFFPNAQVTEEEVFLRWDESNVISTRPAIIDEETDDPFHISMMRRARALADNSSDWWRQVAAVIVRNGKILVEGYSQSYPTEHNPYVDGNPRDFIIAGTLGFLGKTVHAEQTAIAMAARQGIILEGSDLYLNSFPCPPCAFSMGISGIRRCFATGGNAYLDTAETLKKLGIKTIFVKEVT